MIHVSGKIGVSNARGRIARVVGDSVAYVNLESGDSLAFSAEDIDHSGGQTFRRLGVYKGASVRVTSDPAVESDVSVHLGESVTKLIDDDQRKLEELIAKAMEQPGVKEVMKVYGEWQETSEVAAAFQSYQNPYPPSTVTSSSQVE